MRIPARSVCSIFVCLTVTPGAAGQTRSDGPPASIRLVAQGPAVKALPQDEHIDRVFEAKSLRDAQAAERIRHQEAMEQIQAFQKRTRERYNDDMKRCRDRGLGNESECMRAAAARHRQASLESQRLHRREMDFYNHNLAIINRAWAPEPGPRRDGNTQPPPLADERLDAQSRTEARHWARAEARAAEAERRALYERDQREKQRLLDEQRAFERALRQIQQP